MITDLLNALQLSSSASIQKTLESAPSVDEFLAQPQDFAKVLNSFGVNKTAVQHTPIDALGNEPETAVIHPEVSDPVLSDPSGNELPEVGTVSPLIAKETTDAIPNLSAKLNTGPDINPDTTAAFNQDAVLKSPPKRSFPMANNQPELETIDPRAALAINIKANEVPAEQPNSTSALVDSASRQTVPSLTPLGDQVTAAGAAHFGVNSIAHAQLTNHGSAHQNQNPVVQQPDAAQSQVAQSVLDRLSEATSDGVKNTPTNRLTSTFVASPALGSLQPNSGLNGINPISPELALQIKSELPPGLVSAPNSASQTSNTQPLSTTHSLTPPMEASANVVSNTSPDIVKSSGGFYENDPSITARPPQLGPTHLGQTSLEIPSETLKLPPMNGKAHTYYPTPGQNQAGGAYIPQNNLNDALRKTELDVRSSKPQLRPTASAKSEFIDQINTTTNLQVVPTRVEQVESSLVTTTKLDQGELLSQRVGAQASIPSQTANLTREAAAGTISDQVMRAISRQALQQGRFTLQLTPHELGSMEIEFKHERGEIQVAIVAREGATKDLLDANLSRLRQSLQDAGINVADLDVRSEQEQHQRSEQQTSQALQTLLHDEQAEQTELALSKITPSRLDGDFDIYV